MTEAGNRGIEGDWPVTWEAHERDQTLRIACETTPAQRLAWLEAALEFAQDAGALKLDDLQARERAEE